MAEIFHQSTADFCRDIETGFQTGKVIIKEELLTQYVDAMRLAKYGKDDYDRSNRAQKVLDGDPERFAGFDLNTVMMDDASVIIEANENAKRGLNIQDHAFLFLNAPTQKIVDGKQIYTFDESVEFRKSEIDKFVDLFHIAQNATRVQKDVTSPDHVDAALTDFFQNEARNVYFAWVVFNGHGSCDGKLCFEKGVSMHVNTFANKVIKLNKEYRKYSGKILPAQIVFAQCYGYMVKKSLDGKYSTFIETLTDRYRPTTLCSHQYNPLDSEHEDLTRFSETRNKKTAQPLVPSKLPSTQLTDTEAMDIGDSEKIEGMLVVPLTTTRNILYYIDS